MNPQINLPPSLLQIPYNASNYPGKTNIDIYQSGGNCQLFAYELLRLNGKELPPFRSSDLWEDEIYTQKVTYIKLLDLLFFNRTNVAWGAHIGVYLGDDQVIHSSVVVGKPAIWGIKEFQKYDRYQVFIGAKSVF